MIFSRTGALKTAGVALLFAAAFLAIAKADAQERSAARQQERASLRKTAIVDGDVVTLGDLVERCGRLCATPLFRAPAPGESGTIQAMRVLAASRDAGLADLDVSAAPQIVITRTGRAASREEIDSVLAQAIAGRTSIDIDSLSITLDQPHVKLSLAARGEDAPSVADLVIDTRARRFSASLMAPQTHGVAARVTGSFVETVSVPVLTRSVQRGDAIRDDDVVVERRDRDSFGDEPLLSAKMAVGRVARQALKTGALLRDRDLVKPLLVERNMPVTLTLDSGALQLTLKGKANESGALGDVISVQNLNSKRVLQGVVTGQGQARIQQGNASVARTAAAQ